MPLSKPTKADGELIGGARYSRQELDVNADLEPPGGGPSIEADQDIDEDWVAWLCRWPSVLLAHGYLDLCWAW